MAKERKVRGQEEILLKVGKRNSEEWDKIGEALKPLSEYKISYSNIPKFLNDGKK